LGSLVGRAQARGPRFGLIATLATFLVLAAYGLPLTQSTPGTPFPGATLRSAAAGTPGCIAADDPATLIEMNVLDRNLDRGCVLVADLSGWTYEHPAPPGVPRDRYLAFQNYAFDYLRNADAAIVSRFSAGVGFSQATMKAVAGWPVIRRNGRFVLRHPVPNR
jgi:hypothetical protein